MRITSEEKAQLVEAADQASLTVSAYIRRSITLKIKRRDRKPSHRTVELAQLITELGQVGSALRLLIAMTSPNIEGEIRNNLQILKPLRDEILRALGKKP